MDNHNDLDLILDDQGICNHCNAYDEAVKKLYTDEQAEKELDKLLLKIKAAGKGGKYDCIAGVSGGVDSTYLVYLAKQKGLRVLLVHFDNGWNSELAVKNIENIVQKLGFDLYTYVVNWEEFKDLQLSYFKAGVIDLEFPTDHAILATMYRLSREHKVKYILSGHNVVTEGTRLPKSWVHDKYDFVNLKAIHKKFGTKRLKTFPGIGFFKSFYFRNFLSLEFVRFLEYFPYNKKEVKEMIIKELSWRDYGGKHYESIFTRFYQGYILPQKFKVDKRQFHLSSLIHSGQMSREEALEEFKKLGYNEEQMKMDKEFVLKKLDFTEESWANYMDAPIKKHTDYPSDKDLWEKYFALIRFFKPLIRLVKK